MSNTTLHVTVNISEIIRLVTTADWYVNIDT